MPPQPAAEHPPFSDDHACLVVRPRRDRGQPEGIDDHFAVGGTPEHVSANGAKWRGWLEGTKLEPLSGDHFVRETASRYFGLQRRELLSPHVQLLAQRSGLLGRFVRAPSEHRLL